MVNTLPAPQNLVTDDWVRSTWDKFVELCDPLRVSQVDLKAFSGMVPSAVEPKQ